MALRSLEAMSSQGYAHSMQAGTQETPVPVGWTELNEPGRCQLARPLSWGLGTRGASPQVTMPSRELIRGHGASGSLWVRESACRGFRKVLAGFSTLQLLPCLGRPLFLIHSCPGATSAKAQDGGGFCFFFFAGVAPLLSDSFSLCVPQDHTSTPNP